MNKLMKMLACGVMPDFAQVLAALNDISDVDWNAAENAQLSAETIFKTKCIAKYPDFAPCEFCPACD